MMRSVWVTQWQHANHISHCSHRCYTIGMATSLLLCVIINHTVWFYESGNAAPSLFVACLVKCTSFPYSVTICLHFLFPLYFPSTLKFLLCSTQRADLFRFFNGIINIIRSLLLLLQEVDRISRILQEYQRKKNVSRFFPSFVSPEQRQRNTEGILTKRSWPQ